MTLYKFDKVYNTASETDIKKFAFKLTSSLKSKDYSITSSKITNTLVFCGIKKLHKLEDTFEINFTLFNFLHNIREIIQSLDILENKKLL